MAVSGTTTQLHLHERTHVLGLGTWGEGAWSALSTMPGIVGMRGYMAECIVEYGVHANGKGHGARMSTG